MQIRQPRLYIHNHNSMLPRHPAPVRSVKLFTKTPRSCAHPYSSAFLPRNHQITPSPLTNHPKLNTVSTHVPSIIPNALFSIGPSAPLQVAQIKSDNGV